MRGLDVDGAGGLGDGVAEQAEGGPGRRGGGRSGRAVEADDRVEVDDPAALVFGDLGVGEPGLAVKALLVSPAWRARVRRRVMVKRRHSSGAQALNRTEPV
jgi:hypothetical protein